MLGFILLFTLDFLVYEQTASLFASRFIMEEKIHKVKQIRFQGRSIAILLQNEDGPCALLAICNIL